MWWLIPSFLTVAVYTYYLLTIVKWDTSFYGAHYNVLTFLAASGVAGLVWGIYFLLKALL